MVFYVIICIKREVYLKMTTNTQDPKPVTGYVTFADILGWKGIWRDKDEIEVVKSLLFIEEKCNQWIDKYQFEYLLELSETKLHEFYKSDYKKAALKEILEGNRNLNDLILLGQDTDDNISKKFSDLIYERQRINNFVVAMVEYGDEVQLNIAKKEQTKIQKQYDDVKQQSEVSSEKFDKAYSDFKIELSIELISDTFVITSYSSRMKNEIYIHSSIIRKLIGECLRKDMLIRGATSYGEYYKQGKVFVGSAIDDAASWHEQGNEIGIFFTPKGYILTEKETAQKCLNEKLLCLRKPHLKTKSNSYQTYFVNWGEYYGEFKKAICSDSYKIILPEIVNKIMQSDDCGKKLVKFSSKE